MIRMTSKTSVAIKTGMDRLRINDLCLPKLFFSTVEWSDSNSSCKITSHSEWDSFFNLFAHAPCDSSLCIRFSDGEHASRILGLTADDGRFCFEDKVDVHFDQAIHSSNFLRSVFDSAECVDKHQGIFRCIRSVRQK